MTPTSAKQTYLTAAGVSLAALILYIVTLAPTTQFWDASEYIAAAHALGIPHPPGNPFFVIVAHVWGLLPVASDYARRINFLAAVTSATSAGLWFLIGERWLRSIVAHDGWRRVAAAAGAVVGATMFTVWNQAVANEKVYTISVLSIALILWLTLRWADQPAESRNDNLLVLIVYLLALTATNQLMGLLVAPAVLVYVLLTDPRALLRPRFLIAAGLVAVVGLSVNLFIPIRAHLDPYMNQGDAFTWPALRSVLAREQFAKPSVFDNPMYPPGPENPGRSIVLIGQQFLNYWQYFTWQFGRDWSALAQRLLAGLFLLLGIAGARRHWQADRRSALAMTALVLTLTVALVFYLNFKWGFSQPYTGLEHEVRERDYFFIASFAVWGVWVGIGLAAIAEALVARLPRAGWRFAAPVFLIALIPLVGNRLTASRAGETVARDYARDLLESVDPYALIITSGDNDTFPLWHAQEAQVLRRPYLERAELAVLQIIKDQVGKRPIYFSTSTGNIADQLGLTPYLVGEGLVRRLLPKAVVASDSIRLVEGRGFLDVPRTRKLVFEVYRGGIAAARKRPRGWVDTPSQPSLLGYVFVYDTMAAALRDREPALAMRARELRDAILANTTYAIPRSN